MGSYHQPPLFITAHLVRKLSLSLVENGDWSWKERESPILEKVLIRFEYIFFMKKIFYYTCYILWIEQIQILLAGTLLSEVYNSLPLHIASLKRLNQYYLIVHPEHFVVCLTQVTFCVCQAYSNVEDTILGLCRLFYVCLP